MGEGGLYPWGGGANFLDVFFCCLQVNGPVTGGNYKRGGGRGSYNRRCIVLFTGTRACNSVGMLFSGEGGGTRKRKFILFTTRDTYNSTH